MRLLFFLFVSCASLSAQAQTKNQKLPSEFVAFFQGTWSGVGKFTNGKPIEANLSFNLTLDSCWLNYEHHDQPPNLYHALSMWGIDRSSGQFVAYLFDSFQGHRKFESNGWSQNKLVLTTSENNPTSGLVFQQFTYEKLTDKTFKMSFEMSRDARTWKLIDNLTFTKTETK